MALSFVSPLGNIWVALAAAVIIPMIIAFLFSLITFKRGIKGVYFSLITQAMVLIAFLVADNQQPLTGGRPGINEISYFEIGGFSFQNNAGKVPQVDTEFFGHIVNRNRSLEDLYILIAVVVMVCFLGCLFLVRTKFGKVLTAIRDNEARVLALGYNTTLYKTFVFTLAAGLAGLGGALFVPVIGKIGPTYVNVANSIDVVIFVAVGGRGTLVGAILGTFLVHYGTSLIGEAAKEWRPIVMGSLFVISVMAMPEGIIGVLRKGDALRSYFGVLRKYATFSGRATRREYWVFVLINVVVSLCLIQIDHLAGLKKAAGGLAPLSSIYAAATLLPSLAVLVRRLHDTDRSALWLAVALVPVVGFLVLLVFLALEGTPDHNRFGPDPKGTTSNQDGTDRSAKNEPRFTTA
jgi:urea ABC transporter permease protein UrtC